MDFDLSYFNVEAICVGGLGASSRYDHWIGPKGRKLIAIIEREEIKKMKGLKNEGQGLDIGTISEFESYKESCKHSNKCRRCLRFLGTSAASSLLPCRPT